MKSMVFTTVSLVDAGLYACSITLGDKVVKVQSLSLSLFNTIVQSGRVERDEMATKKCARQLKLLSVLPKLLKLAGTGTTKQQ